MTLDEGTIVGSYRIDGLLGQGGMGVVYGARHVELRRQVALKVLAGRPADPGFLRRFEREGRLQASLEHPHVVTVYEAGESEHGLYIAMRLVQGPTLAELMREGTLDASRALGLLGQVAGALDAAHAAGLVHRDVKPQNVLVGGDDDAYLGDFGLTRTGAESGATASGELVGTLSYLAPEVIKGGKAGPASDRYAFAAMLFEALTGSVLFPRGTSAATLYAHTSEPPPLISARRSELPAALDAVFARALSKDPGERPESAAALVANVEEILESSGLAELGPPRPALSALHEDTLEPPPAEPAAPPPRARRRTALWLAGAALAGAAVAVGAVALIHGGESAAGAPATLSGATVLGSDLGEPGRSVDCRGGRPRPGSPSCTVVQTELPGRTLVVPEDGVVRRWAVRDARGELGLSVVRSRSDGTKQVARSRNEFVEGPGVHVFDTDLAVERGDHLGLIAVPGSAVGVRSAAGAETERWIPVLASTRDLNFGPGTGFDDEVQLRVEMVPGGERRLPRQVNGAEAAGLDPGRVQVRRRLRFANGRPVEVALVRLDGRFVIDEFIRGARTARIDVPDMFPSSGGALVDFEVYAETDAQHLGVYIEYVNDESARVVDHFYDAYPHEFDYID